MFHKFKKQITKVYTALQTVVIILTQFALQFIIIGKLDISSLKNTSFWLDIVLTLFFLALINNIYWNNGSRRGEQNPKYIGSAIEYSIRVNRIKNSNPCKTEDFNKFIDEKNIDLFIEARNLFLNDNAISLNDYYVGNNSKPHCELSKAELKVLKIITETGKSKRYYTYKQRCAIIKSVKGNFEYEKLNAAEILSGVKIDKTKYAVSYDKNKNKLKFNSTTFVKTLLFAVLGTILSTQIYISGWTFTALISFAYRTCVTLWKANVCDEAGYNDIVEIKRGVNINRVNLLTEYTTAHAVPELFKDIETEIAEALKTNLGTEVAMEVNDDK